MEPVAAVAHQVVVVEEAIQPELLQLLQQVELEQHLLFPEVQLRMVLEVRVEQHAETQQT